MQGLIEFYTVTGGVRPLRTRWRIRAGAWLCRSSLQGVTMPRPRFVPPTRPNAPSGAFNCGF